MIVTPLEEAKQRVDTLAKWLRQTADAARRGESAPLVAARLVGGAGYHVDELRADLAELERVLMDETERRAALEALLAQERGTTR